MQIPTVAVQHPDDPSVQMIVNADDAAAYEPWEQPKAKQAPAAGGGDLSEATDEQAAEKPVAAPKQSTGRAGRRGRR